MNTKYYTYSVSFILDHEIGLLISNYDQTNKLKIMLKFIIRRRHGL